MGTLPGWLSHGQLHAAQRIFRDAADEDYVVARLSWKHKITRQFLRSSSQALEKHLKAALLCNNMTADFGHGWLIEYCDLAQLAASNGYNSLERLHPPFAELSIPTGFVYEERTVDFVRRIYEGALLALDITSSAG